MSSAVTDGMQNQRMSRQSNSGHGKKTICVRRWQTGDFIEMWDYENTKDRYARVVMAFLPGRSSFTDEELLDVLRHLNSYCDFEIITEVGP